MKKITESKVWKKISLIALVLALAAIAVSCCSIRSHGKGGSGEKTTLQKKQKTRIINIKVSGTNITIDGKACKDLDELQKKINYFQSTSANKKSEQIQFVLKNDYAIMNVYNQVLETLSTCEKNMNILWTEVDSESE